MRFFLLASVLSLFAAPVLADAQPPLVANHKPAARVVSNEAIPRAAPKTNNVSSRTTATTSDAHQFQTRQLLNLGFGSIINVCVQVTAAVSQSVVTVSGQNLALGVGDCICVETSTGLAATGTQPLTGLITGLTAPATVRVYVNGQQLTPASAVPIANTVLASTCTTLLGANLLTFLLQTVLGAGGSCSGAFQSNAALRTAIGTNICQTNQQTLSAGVPILGTAVNLQNSVPIFNAGATDFNTRCCARACSAGFFACGNTCVATGTNCVSGAVVPVVRKRRDQAGAILCPKGLTGCLVPGSRVYDCVDVKNDLESCGGCVDPANPLKPGSGTDCTSLVGVNDVECVRGTCQIRSCNKGYSLAANGTSCESIKGAPALKINSSTREAVIRRKAARTFSRM